MNEYIGTCVDCHRTFFYSKMDRRAPDFERCPEHRLEHKRMMTRERVAKYRKDHKVSQQTNSKLSSTPRFHIKKDKHKTWCGISIGTLANLQPSDMTPIEEIVQGTCTICYGLWLEEHQAELQSEH